MLNKNDIVRIMNEFGLPKENYWIVTGAGLVMHGVKSQTKDIDLGCTTKLCDSLIYRGYDAQVLEDGLRLIKIGDNIEIFENWFVDSIVELDGLPVATLESIKKQKIELGREKDLKDIDLINKHLENR